MRAMKLGIVINDFNTEEAGYSTTHLAIEAVNRGHEVWYMTVSDFVYDPDENVHAHAITLPEIKSEKHYRSTTAFLNLLRGKTARRERITVEDLDILLLRNNPADDVMDRPWARLVGLNFGRLAMRHGVIVLNDPNGLSQAVNKMYLQYFPERVRPRTLISRNRDDIKHFIKEQNGAAVLKPLAGSGGRNVFLIEPYEKANINQIIDAVSKEGYIIAQEYLPEAVTGDTRLFLMNGQPLQRKGHYAAIHRARNINDEDMRSNMTAGARARRAEVTDDMLRLADEVRPKLMEDGMFLVGVDIVGDKLMEINVFSPGGLYTAGRLEGVNFTREVIQALENKVNALQGYRQNFHNVELATL
jgi:glutathione synthase